MKLLCFHCAGGSSSMFKRWKMNGVEIVSIDLPGRGKKGNLPLVDSFNEATESLIAQVEETIQDGEPWGVFGHSMGALFAYEITRRLKDHDPLFRVLSGVNPLQEYNGAVQVTTGDNHTLMEKMGALGGIPDHLQKHPMFIKWFAPILRADLSLVGTFTLNKESLPLPTYVINGTEDRIIDIEKIHLWKECMDYTVTIKAIKGDHFQILKHPEVIHSLLLKYVQVGAIY
ncbi:thioesterase II family protein [Guptibacillus spartinae]|uniref:thioesterase II family protein n=1 Tax=Guptibacillus spartinae TaxID=3025679 RepID=UPI0023626EEB|nr:alpha/beta fold hydrolase [Pseudalkalibacillus spartinae]